MKIMVPFASALILILPARALGQVGPWIEAGIGLGRSPGAGTTGTHSYFSHARAALGFRTSPRASLGVAVDGGSELDIENRESYRIWSAILDLEAPGYPTLRVRVGAGRATGASSRRFIGEAARVGWALEPQGRRNTTFVLSADYIFTSIPLRSGKDFKILQVGVGLRFRDGPAPKR